MDAQLNDAEIREIQSAIGTAEGRSTIAQEMMGPFKLGRDYVAIGRQVFAVDHLPAGAPMYYDLDPQFRALVVGPKGGVDLSEIQTTRVSLEPFILAVYPKVHVMDVATRRFGILDRAQERAQIEMAGLEDDKIFAAFKNSGISVNDAVNNGAVNSIVTGSRGLSPEVAAEAFAAVEQFDIPVANIIVNAQQQRDLRLWSHRNYDPVTQRELLKTGYLGDLWGAMVRQSRRQTRGEVNFLGDPQYLGVISVRIDLSHMDAPDPQNLFYGWVFFEALGVAQLKGRVAVKRRQHVAGIVVEIGLNHARHRYRAARNLLAIAGPNLDKPVIDDAQSSDGPAALFACRTRLSDHCANLFHRHTPPRTRGKCRTRSLRGAAGQPSTAR